MRLSHPPPKHARARLALLALGMALLVAGPARAQLRLPGPTVPGGLGGMLPRVEPIERGREIAPLDGLRQRALADLLQHHRDRVEADPNGAPVRRGELLLIAPTPLLLAAARAAGYGVLRDEPLDGLDLPLVVVSPPSGMGSADALARLRTLDPTLQADFNHLYSGSGELRPPGAPASTEPVPLAPGVPVRVGLIDGGIDRTHPALRSPMLHTWGCDGTAVASAHGTAVASLLVGRFAPFAGAAPGATLYAADVYCGQPTGGASDQVAQALAWLARERVAVVNISLVGPPNLLLERVVRAMAGRGHVLLAAVGNDGPAAPPLYPAAYPGVVGVTAVDAARHVLPEAGRGRQVAFAAPGAEMAVAAAGDPGYASARGTSFAAPLVAGLLARQLATPEPAAAAAAVDALARTAIDLGAHGRDTTYGWGLVGETLRTPPARVAAARRELH